MQPWIRRGRFDLISLKIGQTWKFIGYLLHNNKSRKVAPTPLLMMSSWIRRGCFDLISLKIGQKLKNWLVCYQFYSNKSRKELLQYLVLKIQSWIRHDFSTTGSLILSFFNYIAVATFWSSTDMLYQEPPLPGGVTVLMYVFFDEMDRKIPYNSDRIQWPEIHQALSKNYDIRQENSIVEKGERENYYLNLEVTERSGRTTWKEQWIGGLEGVSNVGQNKLAGLAQWSMITLIIVAWVRNESLKLWQPLLVCS